MNFDNMIDLGGGIIIIALTAVIVGSRNTRGIIQSLGSSAQGILRTSMGR